MTDNIEVSFHGDLTSGTRQACWVCGGELEKLEVPASFEVPASYTDEYGAAHCVCLECLEAGPDAIPGRLISTAESLEGLARIRREAAECDWYLPTPEEWHEAQRAAEVDEEFARITEAFSDD